MCLAMPARIETKLGGEGWVLLGDTRLRVSLCLTPEAEVGDWVLVHAGFAIEQLDERAVRETWELMGLVENGQAVSSDLETGAERGGPA